MKIICESCQSKYTVADEKVQGKTAKIKCKRCGTTILVNEHGVMANGAGGAEAETGAEATGGSYMVNVADNDQRSMSIDELVEAYNSGVITADTFIWADGMSDWQPLSGVDEVVAALHAQAEQPAAPAPVAAPRAAAVRRDHGRADLFGAGMQTPEPAPSAPAYVAPPTPSGAGMTGAREENSMLFSLSALTAKVPASMPASTAKATKEDSGLIDLRALSASVGSSAPSASSDLLPDSAALFPLGMPVAPPSQAPVVAAIEPPPAKSKTPIFLAIGAVIALGAVGAAFFVGQSTKPDVAAQVEAAPPAAPVETAPAPTAEPTAEPSAEASVAASASAAPVAAAPKYTPKPSGGAAKPATTQPASGGAAKPAAAAPKKGGTCGCPPGDLMCAMKCSAGK